MTQLIDLKDNKNKWALKYIFDIKILVILGDKKIGKKYQQARFKIEI